MSPLAEAVRALVAFDRRSPALMVQKPNGEYHISPNGYGDGLDNVYVISRAQIRELMSHEDISFDGLTDTETVERLAKAVGEFHRQRMQRP